MKKKLIVPGKDVKTPDNAESSLSNTTASEKTSAENSETQMIDSHIFPIVGVGASAGGLHAFEAFFSGIPADADPGIAFVLVQHLAPDHCSRLCELIRRCTKMDVFEVKDGMTVKQNCVYIIPPNYDIAILNGTLHLLDRSVARGQRLSIDFFFRTLAEDRRDRAIGVVLSGTGSDGTLGVRAIKGEGGMVMVQAPESAEFDGMPRSAIFTGIVDYILPPSEMPAHILNYISHAFKNRREHDWPRVPESDNAIKKIFIFLRLKTGHDFSQYKLSTITRRVERRMALQQIENINDYVHFLDSSPEESESLFRDLLIGVTSFFRDDDVFSVLQKKVIPLLFSGKHSGAQIRIWVPGCSTGEEAYSIAILLIEHMDSLKQGYQIQIFATDIDSQSIDIARSGIYPSSISSDISEERLARFFTPGPDGSTYTINKNVRNLLTFSEQDIIKDPPFSKLDMISCRNLLIYMGGDLQKKIIPLFHYALNSGGVLLLGTSETAGDTPDLFTNMDRKSKIYICKKEPRETRDTVMSKNFKYLSEKLIYPRQSEKSPADISLPLREITEKFLLQKYAPVSVLVNEQGNVLYIHGRSGLYMEPAPGESRVNNVIKMAREGLRHQLTIALHKAIRNKTPVKQTDIKVRTNGHFTSVNLSIFPIETSQPAMFLITLEESGLGQTKKEKVLKLQKDMKKKTKEEKDTDNQIAILQLELQAKEEYLQTTNEELETANEELKSSNEEMQSLNEELQSINEELETSKEELQSVNEELSTVNTELQNRVTELSQANNDMNNLLSGSGIGTVFIDHQLRIMRFTPAVTQIINLILTDIGRPVGHIVSNLVGYNTLISDVQSVLDTLVPREIEVQTTKGIWFMMRIQPYRTLHNVIEGAVITFVDITTIKKAQESIKEAERLRSLAIVARDSSDAITVQDLQGQILTWNRAAEALYGWSEEEALALNARERIPENNFSCETATLLELSREINPKPYITKRTCKDGRVLKVSIISTAIVNGSGEIYALATNERASDTRKKGGTPWMKMN